MKNRLLNLITAHRPATAAARTGRRALNRRGPAPLALEPRIMFDGAGAEAVLAAIAADHQAPVAERHAEQQEAAALPLAAPAAQQQRSEIVFIEDNVRNLDQLKAAMRPGVEVVILDHTRDGLQQINEALRGHAPLDAIHLVSHGSTGQIELGSTSISSGNVDAMSAQLAQLGQSLAPGADLLIYGCDVAAGEAGESLIGRIAALTGADVAASTDVTGSATFGGNWQLEHQQGVIDSAVLAVDSAAWDGRLAETTVYNANWATLNFNGANVLNIIGTGTNTGNVVRFNSVITIDGQAVDAVVTTTLDRSTLTAFDSTANPSTNSLYFQPNLAVTSAGGGATFQIDFYKAGTYTAAGTGTAVTLQNVVVNSYDIDGVGSSNSDRQYQQFKGFARYELANATFLVPTTLPDGSVNFQYTAASAVNNATATLTADGYRIKVYYDSMSSLSIKSGASATGASAFSGTAYFSLDFSVGPNWTGATTITGTPAANVSYSATSFAESAANNGAIGSTATITLANGTFSGSDGQALAGVTFANTPAGLTAVVTRTSATTASVSFTGQATAHANANDISNFGITLGNAAFASGNAGAVTGAARADLVIDFIDPPADVTAPVVGAGQSFTYAENRPASTVVGTVAASDAVGVTGFRFSATNTATSADGFFSLGSDGKMTLTATGANAATGRNDFEVTPGSNAYGVQARDAAGNWSGIQNVTVAMSNLDEVAPAFSSGASASAADAQNLLYTAQATDNVDFTDKAVTYSLKPATGDVAALSINAASGAVTLASGTLNAGTKSSYTFTVIATDATGNTREQGVSITVTPGNRAPVAAATSFTTAEDNAKSGSLPAASDADGDAITYAKASDPTHGSVTVAANGSYVYTPVANYNGADAFSYSVSDANGGSNTYTVSVTVTPVNDAPVAAAAAVTTAEDTAGSGTLPAATDIEGDTVTYAKASDPAHGSVTVMANGSYLYTPVANYNGPDAFSYSVSDGNGGSNTYTVSINVTPVNDAPVAASTAISTAKGVARSGTLPAATDADGDTVTYAKALDPAHGSVTVDAAGNYVYTPVAGYTGSDSFSYTVSDGNGGSNSYTVSVSITASNAAPVAANASLVTAEDTVKGGNLPAASDADGDAVTYAKASDPAHGSVTIAANGSYVYTPVANYSGADSFSYSVSDGNGGSNTYTVSITVTPVNDAPVATAATVTTAEDTARSGTLPAATDIEGDTVTYAKASDPSHGSVTVAANGSYLYTPVANYNGPDAFSYSVSDGNGGSNTYTVSINVTPVNDAPVAASMAISTAKGVARSGTLPAATDADGDTVTYAKALDPAHGSVTVDAAGNYVYTPVAGYTGSDSFSYTVSDGNGGSNSYAVSVSVTPSNAAPVAANASLVTAEDTVKNGSLPAASDADGDAVTYAKASDPAHGSVTVAANGAYVYAPVANYHGADTFSYSVSDGNGGSNTYTVSITVTPVNDAPTAAPASISTPENTARSGTLPAATDADGDTVSYAKAADPSHGSVTISASGSYVYTPATGYNGPDSFSYLVSDGNGGSNTYVVSVDVAAVQVPENHAPTAAPLNAGVVEGRVLTGALPAATDIDGDAITYAKAADPAHGSVTVSAGGAYTYTPAAGYIGTDSFSYSVSDGKGGSNTYAVTIGVRANSAPLAAPDNISTPQDQPRSGTLPAASDADGDAITYAKGSDPAHGTLTVNADGSYLYTPAAGYRGSDSFSYVVGDGKGGASAYTVGVTVEPVNQAPVAANASLTTLEDTAASGSLPAASDRDGDQFAYALDKAALHGVATVGADGRYTYTPAADYNGSDSFSYTVTDDKGAANTYTVSVTVTPVNDAPAGGGDAFTTAEDTAYRGTLPAATDREGERVSYAVANGPAHGTLVLAVDGSYTYQPAADYNGADAFSYSVRDASGAASTYQVAITVTPVNDAPVAGAPASASVGADEAMTPVRVPFTDIDSPVLSYSATMADGSALPAWLKFDSTSATLSGTPPADVQGSFSLKISASDGALSAASTFNLTVRPLAGPPQAIAIAAMSRDTGVSATDFITADGSAGRSVSGTLARALASGETVQVSADGGKTWSNAVTSGTSWQASDGVAHSSGWTIEARIVRADASVGASSTRAVILDVVQPAAPAASGGSSFNTLPILSGSAAPGPGDTVRVTVDGATYTVVPQNGQWSLDLAAVGAAPLQQGRDYPVTVSVTDPAGNSISNRDGSVLSIGVTPPPALPVQAPAPAPVADSLPSDRPIVIGAPAGVQAAPLPGVTDVPLQAIAAPPAPLAASPTLAAIDRSAAAPVGIGTLAAAPSTIELPAYGRVAVSGEPVTSRAVLQAAPLSDVYTRNEGFRTVVAKADEPMLVLFQGVPDQYADSGSRMMLTIPADAFVHTQANAIVALAATQQDGRPLPQWVNFNSQTGQFSGEVPKGLQGELRVKLVARDSAGREATALFRVNLGKAAQAGDGKSGLSEQLRKASSSGLRARGG